ncbi:hypothetical protein NP233_g2672 [Leucocoprinus birnbaumii]|uniref:FAD-binding domain-containing protein n=1 Tax=Leucocoprinus birnbaumii TaxID=56174 RepID=A0AAD5W0Z0_9AGAR|nr:hypothetical protein NP233_g2672 [Leucocoprinus birnbaumii]
MPSTKLSHSLLPLILLLFSTPLVPLVQAANDWSQPCFSGVCSYDLPASSDGPSGTLKIWGAEHAIADITPAAGWEILGCDSQSLAQDIRIVCKNPDSSGGCSNLFATPTSAAVRRDASSSASPSSSAVAAESSGSSSMDGGVGKVVRLPENCGKSAFARITKMWIPADQSIPASVSRRLVRRDGETPQVKALNVDVNFGADQAAKYGPVNFVIVGANFPGAAATGDLDTSGISTANSTTARRSLSRIYVQRGIGDFLGKAVDAVSSLNDFDVDKSTKLKPFDLNKSFNLIDKKIDCSAPLPVGSKVNATVGVSGEVKVDVDAKVHAVASLGVVAAGTVIPPKVTDFGITSGLTANLDSTIKMTAGVGGSIDSGEIKLFEVGIPGLDFPGVLSIGPTFQVNAEGKATLDLDVDLNVGVKWSIDKAQFTFPKGGSKGGSFKPQNTPLELAVQPSGTATGEIEVHLIPSLNLGIEALGGTVGAEVFVNLDASATATFSGTATGPKKSVTVGRREISNAEIQEAEDMIYPAVRMIRGRGAIGDLYFNKRNPQPFGFGSIVDGVKDAAKSVGSAAKKAANKVGGAVGKAASAVKGAVTGNGGSSATTSVNRKPATTTSSPKKTPSASPKKTKVATTTAKKTTATAPSTSATEATSPSTAAKAIDNSSSSSVASSSSGASFGGCLEANAGLSVNVGASGSFFGLFDSSTELPLFSKDFSIFKKCFGNAKARREEEVKDKRSSSIQATTSALERRAFKLKCNSDNVGEKTNLLRVSNSKEENEGILNQMSASRIAIIGGGPGGLMLARLLKLQGIPFRLFELDASSESRSQGGSLDLHTDSGQKALKAAGLFTEFKRLSRQDGAALKFLERDGTVVWADDGLSPEGSDIMPPDRPEIDRQELRKILLDSLDEGTVEWGKKVILISEDEDSTEDRPQFTLELADGMKVSGFELIVGADGAWSRVRPLLTDQKPFYSGVTNVEARIENIDEKHPDLADRVGRGTCFQANGPSILLSQRNGQGNVKTYAAAKVDEGWVNSCGIDWTDSEGSKRALIDLRYAGVDKLGQGFVLRSDGLLTVRPLYMLPIEMKWETRPGVTLIGDSAHLMTIFAGVGVNLALTDALDLSQAIRSHFEDAIDWTTVLRQFEAKMLTRSHVEARRTFTNMTNFFGGESVQEIVRRLGEVMVGNE